jgi:hypothetical protein
LHTRTATWACAVVLARVVIAGAQVAAPSAADTQLTNYAFASELGSGIYAIDGRAITVYQLPLDHPLRPAAPRGGRPGIKLLFPVTFGFFNFQPIDLAHGEVPSSIGALSIEPGVELDYWLSDAWHVYPYLKAGASFASSSTVNAMIYGAGARSDYRFAALGGRGLWSAVLAYGGVHYRSELPNDSFTRLRNGLELRHGLPWQWRGRALEAAPYAFADVYLKPPEGPASGINTRTTQLEVGFTVDVIPGWRIGSWRLPRLGLGYRAAGLLSGWRLVIGDPF